MNPFDVLKNLQGMQEKMTSLQANLKNVSEVGHAAGGLVKVTINGGFLVTKVEIDPSLAKPEDVELLSELICSASREAHQKIEGRIREQMSSVTGGMGIPPGFGLGL